MRRDKAVARVPDAVQRAGGAPQSRDPGIGIMGIELWTPDQQRII